MSALLLAGLLAGASELIVWRHSGGSVRADAEAPAGPLAVGSLQKPFVVKAWALANADRPTPRVACPGGDRCWLRSGHGTLGLRQAVAWSCNAYFRRLAQETPLETLRALLRDEGFVADDALSVEAAIGAGSGVAIAPAAVLAAYVRLVREPWVIREAVRRELLGGMRDAAAWGTASGWGHPGWAKTGTAPAASGVPLSTSGWIVVVDDAGDGALGLLLRGTGREAARALGTRREDPTPVPVSPLRAATPRVRVALFSLLRPREVVARNVGSGPVAGPSGFVGPEGEVRLRGGDRLGDGLWELRLMPGGLRRRLHGALAVAQERSGELHVVASLEPREYVLGILAGELGGARPELTPALGAAVLRFLARGPRHADADVCDSTHCAYFIGRGPAALWPRPELAVLVDRPGGWARAEALDAGLWSRILALAGTKGPDLWPAHRGGSPLAARELWGAGDATTTACPRHSQPSRPWTRTWSTADAERAFGPGVTAIALAPRDGTWRLAVTQAGEQRLLLYDEAHRALAKVLGWGALPSPALQVSAEPDGFRASGYGLGHRVGLCLGD